MQPFFEWFARTVNPSEPWLILGKGPSFAIRDRFDLSGYCTLSLNHAVREQPVLLAHVIDVDVIEACGAALESNAGFLVMPWYPHNGNRVGTRTLAELAAEMPLLRRLDAEDRLLWYDLSTSPVRHGSEPVVEATYFSAEAALNLLAASGVRRVRSLGVDGGSAYSSAFADLRDHTLLANGRTSFDLQFEGFARTIMRTGVDFAPLDRRTPATVYVAHGGEAALQLEVLEHSIRRRASLTVNVVRIPPASAIRAAEGDAVVLTSRAQVLVDLRPLWRAEIGDLDLAFPAGSEAAPGILVAGAGLSRQVPTLASLVLKQAPIETMVQSAPAAVCPVLAPEWNPGCTGGSGRHSSIVLYPADGSEPWLSRGHPLGHLWMRDLLDGISSGFIWSELVAEEVRRGHARPSLLYQAEQGLEEPLLLPRRARLLDRGFEPPRQQGVLSSTPELRWSSVLRAVGRQLARRTRALRHRRTGDPRPSGSGLALRP